MTAFRLADVGGFFFDPDAELLTRWFQAGIWYPFFRAHAHIDTKRREPWLFGEPYTSIIRAAIVTRYQFLPYWYTLFRRGQIEGAIPIRYELFDIEFNSKFKIGLCFMSFRRRERCIKLKINT